MLNLKVASILLVICAIKLIVFADEPIDFTKAKSVYDFYAQDIKGNNVSLDKYKGHVLIIVNVASNCGLTETNYKQLNDLYSKYSKNEGLRILAFPCNQFKEQEPGTNEEILAFAKEKGVEFDMYAKIEVNGENAHPLYKYLKHKQPGTNNVSDIEWNFEKFIVNKDGQVVERHSPKTEPLELIPVLEKQFKQ